MPVPWIRHGSKNAHLQIIDYLVSTLIISGEHHAAIGTLGLPTVRTPEWRNKSVTGSACMLCKQPISHKSPARGKGGSVNPTLQEVEPDFVFEILTVKTFQVPWLQVFGICLDSQKSIDTTILDDLNYKGNVVVVVVKKWVIFQRYLMNSDLLNCHLLECWGPESKKRIFMWCSNGHKESCNIFGRVQRLMSLDGIFSLYQLMSLDKPWGKNWYHSWKSGKVRWYLIERCCVFPRNFVWGSNFLRHPQYVKGSIWEDFAQYVKIHLGGFSNLWQQMGLFPCDGGLWRKCR